jgi:acyl-CoA synthetase (AMP-forming)/AMP-acid ligase II
MTTPITNVATHLAAMAARQPGFTAVIQPHGRPRNGVIPHTAWTFRQLNDRANAIARGLDAVGVRQGVKTALLVPPSLDFYALTFAIFKVGAIPVFIDPGIGIKRFGDCLSEAKPMAFIGIPKAQLARVILGWSKASVELVITAGRRFLWGGLTLDEVVARGSGSGDVQAPTRADETAAILFTSGSTGPPKGVVYTHSIFAAQIEALKSSFGIEPGEVDVNTFPLFALFAPALGTTAVIPEMDSTRPAHVDPTKIIEEIHCFQATMMFGSPALLDRVGHYGKEHGIKLPTLRRVISAGAPANNEALEAFSTMLDDDVEIFTPYGATEALPVAKIGTHEILGETRARESEGAGVCVGRPVGDMEIAVIAVSDGPIPEWRDELRLPDGEIGEIVVKGAVVTREYFARPEATSLAKIYDSRGTHWHRMGDVGYIDGAARLWFCGRKSQRVITAGGTLFTVACERIFNQHPDVSRTALVGVPEAGAAASNIRIPVLCVELVAGSRPSERITRELLEIGAANPMTRSITRILFHPDFPVDTRHNAKIQREQLALWASRRLA